MFVILGYIPENIHKNIHVCVYHTTDGFMEFQG